MKRYISRFCLLVLLSVFALTSQAVAGAYPEKTITIVVPYGAGGDTDLTARLVGRFLKEALDVPVIITNMKGASGTIATSYVKDEAKADGYTVLFNHSNTLINYMTGLTDYTYTDFKLGGIPAISTTATWVVAPDSKYKTIQDIIADAKARPGQVVFPVLTAATTHMQALEFETATGVEFNKVDIGGGADRTRAFLSGTADLLTAEYGTIVEYIKAGSMKPLAVYAEKRNPLFPEVPTFIEQGIPVSQQKIYFFSFPKETPDSVVQVFTKALESVTKDKEFLQKCDEYFVTASYSNPEDATARLSEHTKYFDQFKKFFKK